MRVCYVLRQDAKRKPGGDTAKVDWYASILAARGHSAEVTYGLDRSAAPRADIYHLLNLDLPIENLSYATRLRRLGAPVVLSTIRHPFAGLQGLYRHGDDEYFRLARAVGMPHELALVARERIKLAPRFPGIASHRLSLMSYVDVQRGLVESVDKLLAMAPGEADALVSDFAIPAGQVRIVPNGFSFVNQAIERRVPLYDIAMVGRIEPRKNTNRALELARAAGLSVLVMGAINDNHRSYARRFREIVSSSEGITYWGRVGADAVKRGLAGAKVYLNPAWFEVVSQADCEAAALGVPVVTTRHSYASDFLQGSALELDPAVLSSVEGAEYLASQLRLADAPLLASEITWEMAVDALLGSYQELI